MSFERTYIFPVSISFCYALVQKFHGCIGPRCWLHFLKIHLESFSPAKTREGILESLWMGGGHFQHWEVLWSTWEKNTSQKNQQAANEWFQKPISLSSGSFFWRFPGWNFGGFTLFSNNHGSGKLPLLETELLSQRPIFHFHVYGRKSNFRLHTVTTSPFKQLLNHYQKLPPEDPY